MVCADYFRTKACFLGVWGMPSELGESCHVSREHKMPGSTWPASRPRGLAEGVGITVVPAPEILRELRWSAVARAAAGDSRGSHTPQDEIPQAPRARDETV